MRELVISTREYLIGITLEVTRRELPADNHKRRLELAAYFTHCNLQPQHALLALQTGVQVAKSAKNTATAARFARRIVALNPPEKILAKVCSFYHLDIFRV